MFKNICPKIFSMQLNVKNESKNIIEQNTLVEEYLV